MEWISAPAFLAAVLALAAIFTLRAAWIEYDTYDESRHLEWSQRLLDTGETERFSRMTFNSKTPICLANAAAREAAAAWGGRARFAARLPTLGWLVCVVLVTYRLARRVTDRKGASLAVLPVALDLNFIAHGSLATVDVAFAASALLTVVALARFAERPTVARAALVGLALGLAFSAKFSAVLLLGPLVLMPLAVEDWRPGLFPWLRRVVPGLVLVAGVAAGVICSFYLFQHVALPLADLHPRSAVFQRLAAAAPRLRLPLPRDFLTGLDQVLADERTRSWHVYLLGHVRPDSVWYYFPVVWALKTPVLVAAGIVLGLLDGLRSGRLWRLPLQRYLFAAWIVLLTYFSFFFRAQIGLRFVLICMPVAAVLAAPAWRRWLERPLGRAGLAAGAGTLLVGNLLFLGNPLAYTNLAVWPKAKVYRLIADSNIDWGQNADRDHHLIRMSRFAAAEVNPPHPQPGLNAVDLNRLVGIFGDPRRYQWLRENLEPVGHFRHTYILFDLPEPTFARFLEEDRRLVSPPALDRFCPEGLRFAAVAPSTPVRLEREDGAPDSVLCLRVERPSRLVVATRLGEVYVGPSAMVPGRWTRVTRDERGYYLLEPGGHAVSLRGDAAWQGTLTLGGEGGRVARLQAPAGSTYRQVRLEDGAPLTSRPASPQ